MFNYDKLVSAIEQSGKTKTYLCQKLGRPPYYLRDVIKQKNAIPSEYQNILAHELGVTVEYLNDSVEQTEKADSPKGTGLSPAKEKLIAAIDDLSDEQCEKLFGIIEEAKKLL